MTIERISAVLICGNAEATLATCLDSLAGFDDVVVYLNSSTDGSRAICAGFANVRVVDGEFIGFGPTKNAAVAEARNDWVLSIDTDEWLDDELRRAVGSLALNEPARAYSVLRKNRFLGRHVAHGGWGNDTLVRLFHRGHARFNDKLVHEKLVTDSAAAPIRLPGTLWHDAVVEIDQFLRKISAYSTLAAKSHDGRRAGHPAVALVRSAFAFVRSYVLQLGFVAGWRGVVIAYSRAVGTFYKYVKRYTKARGLE
ncbi:MAG: glycosyltransferase family 2 protein [Pseudomonadota bacterium]